MSRQSEVSPRPLRRVMTELWVAVLLAGVAAADHLVWLGWDQRRDVRANGSETGPYEAWQVAGLVLVLTVVGIGAVWRGHGPATVIGVTAGLTAAVSVDWSDDESGLWLVGAVLVFAGTLAGSAAVAAVVASIRRAARRT